MKYILGIWGVVSLIYGGLVLVVAKSAIHEIQVGVALTIATLGIGFGCVIHAIDKMREEDKS